MNNHPKVQEPNVLTPRHGARSHRIYPAALLVGAMGAWLACSASAQAATFDFDTATPTLQTSQGLPLDQTAGGVTAHFSASSGGFSVQTASSMGGLRLSMFTNRFLSPSVVKSVMDIQFSRRLTNITFSFATIQVAPIEIETPIELAASLDAAPAGTTNAAGVYGGPTGNDSWPMGTLTFRSRAPFNAVRIRVPTIVPPPNTGQATDFLLDNVTVALAPPPATNVPPVLAPISNQVATAGTPLSFTILASDENVPAQALTFSLDGTCPAGAALTAAGVFNWTPLGAQGPSNYVFTVRVTDDGTPPLSVTTNFMVSVSLPSRPAMKILPTRTNTAAVSWAWPSPGFLLQEKSVPGTNAWASCTNPVTPVGGRCEVIVPRPATNRFYRLCLP